MNEEEPAWRAELEARVADLFRVRGGELPEWTRMIRTADALGSLIGGLMEPHIQAAEQRGREAALREAAERIRAYVETRGNADLMRLFWRGAANYIDPDTP